MFTTTQMIIAVIVTMIAGAGAGCIFYLLEKRDKPSGFSIVDFSDNFVAPKMRNTDISIDEVVKNFKLLD